MKDKDLKCVDRDDAKCFRLTKKNEKFIRGKQQYQVLQAAGRRCVLHDQGAEGLLAELPRGAG